MQAPTTAELLSDLSIIQALKLASTDSKMREAHADLFLQLLVNRLLAERYDLFHYLAEFQISVPRQHGYMIYAIFGQIFGGAIDSSSHVAGPMTVVAKAEADAHRMRFAD